MKRFLLLLFLMSSSLWSLANHWVPDPHQFSNNMNIIGVLEINGVEQSMDAFEVGVFCEDECRGSEMLTYYEGLDRYMLFMTLYGQSGDVMSFRLYDHNSQRELDLTPPETIQFGSNDILGSISDPYIISFSGGIAVITAVAVPEAGGTITGAAAYWLGETCTLQATANQGYTFVDWTENGQQVSTEATLSIYVMESHDMQANFSVNSYEVSVEVQPEEGGTAAGTGIYDYGTTVTVSAIPNEHFEFVNWTEDGVMVSNLAEYTFTLNRSRHLVANFAHESFTVSATVLPANAGVIEGLGNYVYGQTATLIALPNANYEFLEWTENGAFVSNQTSFSFVVTQNRVFKAYFTYYDGMEEKESAISVFPNPTSGIITVTGVDENSAIRLYDMKGCLILEKTSDVFDAVLDLGFVQNGYYYLVVAKEQKRQSKLVKVSK